MEHGETGPKIITVKSADYGAKLRFLGLQDYLGVWQAMQQFTLARTRETADELWITEHPPVYTLGLNGKAEHLLNTGSIPVIKSDRGGQVTYHGPGQLVVYTLIDIRRINLGVRQLVSLLEQAMINALAIHQIDAIARPDAPGVYVQEKKIGSIGLRIKNHCCYHGLSLNNSLDLSPFNNINTCGYPQLEITKLTELGVHINNTDLAALVTQPIMEALSP